MTPPLYVCRCCGLGQWLVEGVLLHVDGSPDCTAAEAPANAEVDR